jgi:hypothetical protein
LIWDGANAPKQSNTFNIAAATITTPPGATGGQSLTVNFVLAGITTAYLVWMNGSTEITARVPISGTSGAIVAPALAGSYTLAVWDTSLRGTGNVLAVTTNVAVAAAPAESISVNPVPNSLVTAPILVSGGYLNGTPTGLAWSVDGTTFTTATSPTIGAGGFSFTVQAGAGPGGGPYTLRVRDTGNTSIVGATVGAFYVESGSFGVLPSFGANQPSSIAFTTTGVPTPYIGWFNGSSDVGGRTAVSGSSATLVAPAAGTYTLRLYDSATGSTYLDSRTVTVAAQTLLVQTPSSSVARASIAVAGLYANGTPASLDWSVDGSTWFAASAPTITGGAFAFTIPANTIPAGGPYTLYVRDHVTLAQGMSPASFNLYTGSLSNTPAPSAGGTTLVTFTLVGIATAYLVWLNGASEIGTRMAVTGSTATIPAPSSSGTYTLALYDTSGTGSGTLLDQKLVAVTPAIVPDPNLTAIGVANPITFLDASNAQAAYADSGFSALQTTAGGVVKGLRDSSGAGHDLYQPAANAPTISLSAQNGRNGLRFTATSSQMLKQLSGATWMNGLQAGPITALAVFKIVSDANNGSPYMAMGTGSSSNTDVHNSFSINASTTGSPSIQAARHTASNTFSNKDTSLGATAKNLLLKVVARWDPASNQLTVLVNTDAAPAVTTTVAPYTGNPWDSFFLGALPGVPSLSFDGYIFEIDVWNAYVSNSVASQLISYATSKWGS